LCGVAIEERNKVIYVSGRFARQRIQKAALGNGPCDSQELSGGAVDYKATEHGKTIRELFYGTLRMVLHIFALMRSICYAFFCKL